MYTIRNKCTIYDKYFIDDLLPYALIENDNKLYIRYNADMSEISFPGRPQTLMPTDVQVEINQSSGVDNILEAILLKNIPRIADDYYLDVWTPIIIDIPISYSYQTNKRLIRGGSIIQTRLGIENFMKFIPQFQSWNITNQNDTYLSSDLMITSPILPFTAKYGIIAWAKRSSDPMLIRHSSFSGTEAGHTIDKFPDKSRLIMNLDTKNNQYIKLNNYKLFKISERIVIDISLLNNPLFLLASPYAIGKTDYWISDGEYFSYFNSMSDEVSSYKNGRLSRSYISPCLHHKYRQIQHILRCRDIKERKQNNIAKSIAIKKISQILATSPLLDGVTFHYLLDNEIINIINDYLDKAVVVNTIPGEINLLQNSLAMIFKRLSILKLCILTSNKTIAHNYINNRSSLFKKILSKYGASLYITKDTSLTYKKNFTKDSIFINQPIESFCDKKLRSTDLTTNNIISVINNQEITYKDTVITTDMTQNNSQIVMSNTDGNHVNLPLYDFKKQINTNKLTATAGKDLILKLDDISGRPYALPELSTFLKTVSYLWTKTSGPCLKFTDYNRDIYRQIKFSSSTSNPPVIFVYGIGKYVLQVSVSSDQGTLVDSRTIYVVNADGKYSTDPDPELTPPIVPDVNTEDELITIESDYLKVMCPNMSQIAINNKGLFWPIKTDCYINEPGTFVSEDAQDFGVFRLGGNYKFRFVPKAPQSKSGSLILRYKPGTTVIKLDRIILQNMRDGTEECSQCFSFYDDLLVRDKLSYSRKRIGGSTSLMNGQVPPQIIDFNYPDTTTNNSFAPNIKRYGGYDVDILKTLFDINRFSYNQQDINRFNHESEITKYGGHFADIVSGNLPPITGHDLQGEIDKTILIPGNPIIDNTNRYKICHMKPVKEHNASFPDIDHNIFTKGCFHPSSGWLDTTILEFSKLNNKSSVLKFSPGHRDTFRLVGGGFFDMNSSYDEEGKNTPNIYKSTISLNIDNDVAVPPKNEGESVDELDIRSQPRELSDHDVNHGYRFLNGGIRNNYNDEYGIRTNTSDKTDPNCDNKIAISYTLPVRGKTYIPEDGQRKILLQDSDLEGRTIEDIEIKLNFLNYVNTKDLIIWLDVDVCAGEAARINADSRPEPIIAGEAFIDNKMGVNLGQNKAAINNLSPELKDYCQAILDMNTPGIIERGIDSGALTKFRLVLLNREHVENNRYNISLSFSDHASKNNKASNSNIFKSGEYGSIPIHSDIITSKMELLPSISPTGYNEEKSVAFQNIIRSNQLNMIYASFAKFKNLKLFQGAGERANNSVPTSFTLNIAVVDESDNMRIYDNLKYNNTLVGLKSTDVKQESNTITNSLCNWELILHTKPIKRFTDKDGLGLIKYNSMDPDIRGHNFMCDFGKSKHKHQIPPVNINAPNTYLNNMSLCKYNDPELVNSLIHKYPDFPTWAILSILLTGTIQVGMFGGGLITGLAGLGLESPGYAALFGYFRDVQKARDLEEVNSMVDRADYNSFGFGSGEKVLINVRKRSDTGSGFNNIDDLLWYNMEATIFKYKNTKILKNNEYSFIRANRKLSKVLCQFKIIPTSSILDIIINISFIKNIIIDMSLLGNELSGSKTVKGKLLNYGDIILLLDPKQSVDINGLYIVREKKWQKLPESYKYEYKGLQYINILEPNNEATITDIVSKLLANKIIIIPGKRAYYFFSNNETIELNDSSGVLENIKDLDHTAKILHRGIVFVKDKYYTIIELGRSIIFNKEETKKKELVVADICNKTDISSNSTLIVFKIQPDGKANQWGLEKNAINPHKTPEVIKSTFGEGAYGNGSPFIDPDILSAINSSNKLKNIYETFNNHENDRIKYGKVSVSNQKLITDPTTPIANKIIEGNIKGYSYSLEEDAELLQKDNYILLIDELRALVQNQPNINIQNIIDSIQYGTTNILRSSLTFIDLSFTSELQTNNISSDYGSIMLDQDYIESIPIEPLSDADLMEIKNRLYILYTDIIVRAPGTKIIFGDKRYTTYIINNGSIKDVENHHSKLPQDPPVCYLIPKDLQGRTAKPVENSNCHKNNTKKTLLRRYKEKNDLLTILDQDNKNKDILKNPIKLLPYIKNEIVKNSDSSLSVKYNSVNDDVYWINIDPKQGCSLAYEELPKILKKVTYKCFPVVGVIMDFDAINICPRYILPPGFYEGKIKTDGDEIFENDGDTFVYSITEDKIETWKKGYQNTYGIVDDQWKEYLVSKKFFINANGPRDTLVESTEYYDILKEPERRIGGGGGTLVNRDGSKIDNRVYNKFNLMATSNIDVKFKIIPRKIKHIDKHYDKRIITPTGSDTAATPGPSNEGGPVYNEMEQWVCLDPRSMKYTMPTDYLKVQNEMIFRSYYSSIDGIEHKASTSSSLQPWEWIPYEYKLD